MSDIQCFFSALILALILSSCAGSNHTARRGGMSYSSTRQYPAWYPKNEIRDTDSLLYGYANTLAGDSESAKSKAIAWAREQLKSYVFDKLENIRGNAAAEYGNESELGSTQFTFVLRNAKKSVESVAQTGRLKTEPAKSSQYVLGFAEVSVSKEELIDRIGKRLGGYEKAWNDLIESQAFKKNF